SVMVQSSSSTACGGGYRPEAGGGGSHLRVLLHSDAVTSSKMHPPPPPFGWSPSPVNGRGSRLRDRRSHITITTTQLSSRSQPKARRLGSCPVQPGGHRGARIMRRFVIALLLTTAPALAE